MLYCAIRVLSDSNNRFTVLSVLYLLYRVTIAVIIPTIQANIRTEFSTTIPGMETFESPRSSEASDRKDAQPMIITKVKSIKYTRLITRHLANSGISEIMAPMAMTFGNPIKYITARIDSTIPRPNSPVLRNIPRFSPTKSENSFPVNPPSLNGNGIHLQYITSKYARAPATATPIMILAAGMVEYWPSYGRYIGLPARSQGVDILSISVLFIYPNLSEGSSRCPDRGGKSSHAPDNNQASRR